MAKDQLVPNNVRAIALDTNAASKGMYSVSQIEELVDTIDSQELNVEIWIPEPVLWEWAEHAFEMAEKARDDYMARRRQLREAGIPGFDEEPSFELNVNAVVESIEESISQICNGEGDEAVRVLELSSAPEIAVDALRDQILRQGAGRTKSTGGTATKTGAADSASFRLIEEAADGFMDKVVLVSGDKDAYAHFAEKDGPIILRDLWSAKTELIKLKKGSDYAAESLQQTIFDALGREHFNTALLLSSEISGESRLFNPRRDLTYIPEASISRIRDVRAVDSVELSLREKTATAIATITLDMSIEYVRWDYRSESVDSDVEEEYDVEAWAYISADAGDLDDWDFSIDRVEIVDDRFAR